MHLFMAARHRLLDFIRIQAGGSIGTWNSSRDVSSMNVTIKHTYDVEGLVTEKLTQLLPV